MLALLFSYLLQSFLAPLPLLRLMITVSYRHAVSAALALMIATGTGGLRAQGVTDYKPGEGGGPITGSASGSNAKDAAPTLECCPAPLGTNTEIMSYSVVTNIGDEMPRQTAWNKGLSFSKLPILEGVLKTILR